MLTTVAILLVVLGVADILSGICITRFSERLSAALFEAIEEQRQTLRQLRQARSEQKSAEMRCEAAQHKCDEMQDRLSHIQVRLSALAERDDQRKGVKVRGQRSN